MDLNRGQIYFIRERFGTGFTEFTKIGRVAESGSRDSAKRAQEHQTGNPRLLEPVTVVATALHTKVENTLHRDFAHLRIPGGEWFKLDETNLAQAVQRCQGLAELNESYVPFFAAATIASASSVESAMAFSTSTCFPALSAATAIGACWSVTVQMSMRSMSGSASICSSFS